LEATALHQTPLIAVVVNEPGKIEESWESALAIMIVDAPPRLGNEALI
jgi:hypothetical protein